jgi:CDP-diacylglycerol--serine O-phosphatidyltransferase
MLTVLSLIFGFISVILSLESHFTFACWAIYLSVLFDGLDGQVARKNSVPSEFGKELDSLVDVVSFGIAPSVLGYIFVYRDFYLWSTLALFAYLLCAILRLAKYNITTKDGHKFYFSGLPTTVAGGTLASFVLIFRRRGFDGELPQFVPAVFLGLVLLLSCLMVSKIRYLNLDGLKKLFGAYLKLAVSVLAIIILTAGWFRKAGIAGMVIFLIYLLFSPFVVKRLINRV